MVSLKKYLAYSFVFLSFLLLAASKAAAGIPCCKNGKMSTCPDLPNGQQYDVSGCQNIDPIRPPLGPIDPIEPGPFYPIELECELGDVQYRPKGDCDTSEKRCCSNGKWSDWDGECGGSSSCGLNECWNGSKCVSKPSSTACTCNNGTCSLTYRCVSGSGWKSTKNCTCDSGYQKNSSGECVHSSCAKGCSVGQYLREIQVGYNKGQCECCYPSGYNANGSLTTMQNCIEYAQIPGAKKCCRTTAYDGPTPIYYTLPSTFSSCSALGEAIQNPMYEVTCPSRMSGLL